MKLFFNSSQSLSLFLVFITVMLEKLSIALFATMGNSMAAVKQKLSEGDQQSLAINHSLVSIQLVSHVPKRSCSFQKLLLSYMGPHHPPTLTCLYTCIPSLFPSYPFSLL